MLQLSLSYITRYLAAKVGCSLIEKAAIQTQISRYVQYNRRLCYSSEFSTLYLRAVM